MTENNMLEEKTINPFTDIPFAVLPQNDPYTAHGTQDFGSLGSMQIGFGSNVFRADRQGIWLGAEQFTTAESASFAVTMSGVLYATGAIISGTITASSGTIGGFTIGATTLTGNGSGGDILTSSSGERIEIRSSTKRVNFINGSGHTTLSLHTGGTYTSALMAFAPQDDDRGCISMTMLSSNTHSAIDISNAGTGLSVNINQSNTSNTFSALVVANVGTGTTASFTSDNSTSPNHTVYVSGRPNVGSVTNASVLYIDISSSASGHGIYISDPTSSTVTYPLRIARSGNVLGNLYGAKIAVTNSGGNGVGIDLASCAFAFNFAADTTAAGAYKGRIPVTIAGVTKYLHYFDA